MEEQASSYNPLDNFNDAEFLRLLASFPLNSTATLTASTTISLHLSLSSSASSAPEVCHSFFNFSVPSGQIRLRNGIPAIPAAIAVNHSLTEVQNTISTVPPELQLAILDVEQTTLIATAMEPPEMAQTRRLDHLNNFRSLGRLQQWKHIPYYIPAESHELFAMDPSDLAVNTFLLGKLPFSALDNAYYHFVVILIKPPTNHNISIPRQIPITGERLARQRQYIARATPYNPALRSSSLISPSSSFSGHGRGFPVLPVPVVAPIQAQNIDKACEIFKISRFDAMPNARKGKSASLRHIIQPWKKASGLISAMGFEGGGCGDLKDQLYEFSDGRSQAFEEILVDLGWHVKSFIAKTMLYEWVTEVTATKQWKLGSIPTENPNEPAQIATAHKTWKRMVFLWHELGYIDYAEEHTSLTFKRQQKDAAFLRQSHIVKH